MAVFYSQNRPNTNKNKTHKVSTPKVPSQRRSTPLEPNFHKMSYTQFSTGELHCREHHSALQLPSASGKSSALVWTVPLGRGVASTQHHQLPCPPAANTARLWYFHPGLPTPWKWQIRSRRNQQTSGERTALRGACLVNDSVPLCHMHIPYSVLLSFLHATSSRVYTQWHMAQSPKPSLWPLVTGIYPIPSAGSVSDDFFLSLHAFTPLITFGFNL